MAQTIDDAVSAVRYIVGQIDGMRSAPDGIPENDGGIYPFFVAWNGGGMLEPIDASWERGLWNIVCQVHFSRRDLYRAESAASPWARKIAHRLLRDTTLPDRDGQATCSTFAAIEVSGLRPMVWGDTPTIGYEITIRGVKITEARET